MVYKRKILIFCLLLILSVVMAEEIVGNPQIELIDVSEGKCINIELSITNDSDDIIIIPNVYLVLFEDKYVIGDWIKIKNNRNKNYLHKTKFINISLKYEITGNKDDYEELKKNSLILMPYESYSIQYDDIKKYFSIPFWVKNIYISYDGPLGTSNQVQLPIR